MSSIRIQREQARARYNRAAEACQAAATEYRRIADLVAADAAGAPPDSPRAHIAREVVSHVRAAAAAAASASEENAERARAITSTLVAATRSEAATGPQEAVL